MTRRVLAAAALVALAVCVPLAVWAGAQTAPATIDDVGWWTRNPTAQAPEDGFAVAQAPDGPVSVAAFEVIGNGELSRAVLLLRETGGVATEGAAVQVCRTPNTWKSGGAQDFGEAPKAECLLSRAPATRHEATSSWTADVTSLITDLDDKGRVDLMVVPADGAASPLFDVQFAPPELQVEAAPASPSSGSSSGSSGGSFSGSSTPTSSPSSSSSSGDGAPTSDTATGPVVAPPDTTPAVTPPATDTATDGAGAPTAADGAGGADDDADLASLPTAEDAGVDTASGRNVVQAVFFVLVATIAGVGAGFGRWFVRQRSGDSGAFA